MKMRAAFKPGSINAEDRTVEVVFGSDKPVRMYTWEYGPINEELSFESAHVRMDRLNSGAPVLDNHDAYGSVLDTVVGVVEKAWSDGKKGYAKLRFAKTDKGDKMLEMARDGILQNVSVGYAVHKYMRSKSNDEGKLDNYKAVDWEPHEISMVAVPADADAKLRSLAGPENAVTIEDENGKIETRSAEMYDMEGPKGQIESCTDAINELNEEINNSLAAAEAYPEQADLYAAVVAAHKAAISAHLEVIAAVNGQRSPNDIINQRRLQAKILMARFPNK
ncbi:MAG: HK97 family phage prohead protease [Chitinophagaceae bacterium]|nr:HK97 family phage prohead protease [Chitinophagaceae bacterium]